MKIVYRQAESSLTASLSCPVLHPSLALRGFSERFRDTYVRTIAHTQNYRRRTHGLFRKLKLAFTRSVCLKSRDLVNILQPQLDCIVFSAHRFPSDYFRAWTRSSSFRLQLVPFCYLFKYF